MTGHGDIESVNLGTGEKAKRVTGNGESRLESLGIAGLKPVDPADLAEYEKAFEDLRNRPRRGGLICPPEPGCVHDWRPHTLSIGIEVKKCSKCHVLGDP